MQKKVKTPWDKYVTEESMAYKAAGDELNVIFFCHWCVKNTENGEMT